MMRVYYNRHARLRGFSTGPIGALTILLIRSSIGVFIILPVAWTLMLLAGLLVVTRLALTAAGARGAAWRCRRLTWRATGIVRRICR